MLWLKEITPVAAWWWITGNITVFTPIWTAATTELKISVHIQYCFFPPPALPSSLSRSAEKIWNKYWAPSIYHYSGWGISADGLWKVSMWYHHDLWPLTPQSPPDCPWLRSGLPVWCSCITLWFRETDHSLEWALPCAWSFTVRLKDTEDAGYSGWREMQTDLKEQKLLSKPKYKAPLGSTSPQRG